MFDLHMKIYVKIMEVHWFSHINLYENHVKLFIYMKMHWFLYINSCESHVKNLCIFLFMWNHMGLCDV